MNDLLERESYDINHRIFKLWLKNKRPIKLKELKYVCDRGMNIDNLLIYI